MAKAVFQTLPNYEYIDGDIYIVFNGEGLYVTNNDRHIEALEKAKPFIQRIDGDKEDNEDNETIENKQRGEKTYPEHLGGGMYLLSNGEKVKGKKAAEQAENELEK